jgi:hypothetical protein
MTAVCNRAWLAVFGLIAFLAPTAAYAEWRRLETPNFIVIGDASERDLRHIAMRFEGFRETLGRVLGAGATATAVPTVVVVFPHDRAFTPYKPVYQGKPVAVGGVFYSGRDLNYITLLNDDRAGALEVVFHEYAHLVVSNVSMNLPVWLNEGLAEYYSTYEHRRDGREALIGKPIDAHLQLLSGKRLLPLDELISVTRQSPLYNEGERRSLFYAQSWALTHMLILGEPSRLQELSAFVGAVQGGMPEEAAWRQAFGTADIAKALDQYVRRLSLKAYVYKFTEGLTRLEAAAVPLPQPEVSAFLAGLRLRQQRYEDAEALADDALRANAAHPHATVTRARIAIERGDVDAAAARLAALGAVEDWFVAYVAGTALTDIIERGADRSAERLAAARTQLEAAGRTREIANALATLAMLDVLAPGPPSGAGRAAIGRARTLAPGRDDYALIHARLLAELGEFAPARAILGPLLTPGYPDHVRSTARSWMNNVVRMEENERRARARSSQAPPGATPAESPAAPPATETLAAPVFRETQTGEQRLEGRLERITCPTRPPATFHVRTATAVEVLEAPTLADVEFITYRDDLTGSVTCGPLKDPLPVYVTWRPGANAGARRVIAVEFLPK